MTKLKTSNGAKMEVKVDDLRRICEKLLHHVEERHGGFVEIDKDYYWDVSEDERFNHREQPKDLEVGRLHDDLKEIENVLHQKEEPTSYCLVRLASVLRFIGAKLVI